MLAQQAQEMGGSDHVELTKRTLVASSLELAADLEGEAVRPFLLARGIRTEAMSAGSGILVASGPVRYQVAFMQTRLGIEEIAYLLERAGGRFGNEEPSPAVVRY